MINQTDIFLLQLKNKAEQVINDNIDAEIGYIFTNDEEYLNKRTKLIPRPERAEEAPKVRGNQSGPANPPAEGEKKEEHK